MTSISGRYIKITPCCGTSYSLPRYSSMNFMSSAVWTDGYREQSLMPNDRGLRVCQCGNYFLLNELIEIGQVESTDVPATKRVLPDDLNNAIRVARNKEIELIARLDYWQELNHSYRKRYKEHREKEEASFLAQERGGTIWGRVKKMLFNKTSKQEIKRQITFPQFIPSDEQRSNVDEILKLLANRNFEGYEMVAVELYREIGDFEKAIEWLRQVDAAYDPTLSMLMQRLCDERESAVVRYRN